MMRLSKIIEKLEKGYLIREIDKGFYLYKKYTSHEKFDKKICKITIDQIHELIEYRKLQKSEDDEYFIETPDYSNWWYYEIPIVCTLCDSKIRICFSPLNHSIVNIDYHNYHKWRCENKDCINNKCPTNTGDQDMPDWIKFI